MPERLLWVEYIGYILITVDFAGWVFWIAVTSGYVSRGDDLANVGFIALCAPHTVIIPSVLAILHDVWVHCARDPSAECRLETPPYQWIVFPFLVLPLDSLTLVYNQKVVADPYVVAASWWALANTVAVGAWALLAAAMLYGPGVAVYKARRSSRS